MNAVRRFLFVLAHSLSARLLLIFVLASMLYGYAARYAFSVFQDTDYLRQIAGAHIALHSDYILADIGSPPDLERAQAIVDKIPVDIRIVGPDLDWSSSPDFYPLEDIAFGPLSILNLGEASRNEMEEWARKVESVKFARHNEHLMVKLDDEGYEIVFASPRISEMPRPDYSTLIIWLAGITILFLIYLAVRWLFRPVKWMQAGAARIGGGDLEYRIPTPRNDELGDLSREFNTMAEDVQGMLEAKRQLMLAISHELRSPLTRSKVSAEFIDDQTVRQSILDDLGEMEDLISDLLESEALNTRHAVLRREPVEPAGMMASVVETDFANRSAPIEIRSASDLPDANWDTTRIRLLLRNLIDNALRYAAPGEVVLAATSEEDGVRIVVRDDGPGLSGEALERAFERF
ncbi:MAG: HAMP domain-containing protein, partial [Gammaproteobacteria bacterium]|nr:HAMP domain-containing protein [Gammaproteobacteria bacterium]